MNLDYKIKDTTKQKPKSVLVRNNTIPHSCLMQISGTTGNEYYVCKCGRVEIIQNNINSFNINNR